MSTQSDINLDFYLMPELKRLHEKLRVVEREMSADERKEKHQYFVEECKRLIGYSKMAHTDGILALIQLVDEMNGNPEYAMDRELFNLIVDGTEPELVKRVALFKYSSMDQTIYQAIRNIMCIYTILSIQQGEHPGLIKVLIKNMIPGDVYEQADIIDYNRM